MPATSRDQLNNEHDKNGARRCTLLTWRKIVCTITRRKDGATKPFVSREIIAKSCLSQRVEVKNAKTCSLSVCQFAHKRLMHTSPHAWKRRSGTAKILPDMPATNFAELACCCDQAVAVTIRAVHFTHKSLQVLEGVRASGSARVDCQVPTVQNGVESKPNTLYSLNRGVLVLMMGEYAQVLVKQWYSSKQITPTGGTKQAKALRAEPGKTCVKRA